MKIQTLLLALLALPGAAPSDTLAGEQPADETKPVAAKQAQTRYRLLPIPIFITEPAIGEGLGVALTLFHPVKEGKTDDTRVADANTIADITHAREAPPVATAVAGAYTNNQTWLAGVGHANNWKNDSIRYAGGLGAARVNSKIYLANLPLKFSMETAIVYQELKFRLGDSDFILGGILSYMDAQNEFGFGELELPTASLVESDFKNIGVALKAAYDTRDSVMNPHAGQLVDFSLWRYDGAIASSFDYWSAKLKALSFHDLTPEFTLGLRLEVSAVSDGTPFFAVPWVKLRGIPTLRYQNKAAGAVEVEGRYLLAPRWEVSAFGGLGATSDDFPIYENPDSIYNFGIGGRYNVFEAHNVWVGIDIARGPDDWNWYVQVGHPW